MPEKKINTSAKSKGNAVVHLGFIEIFAVDRPCWEICRIKSTYISLALRRFVMVERTGNTNPKMPVQLVFEKSHQFSFFLSFISTSSPKQVFVEVCLIYCVQPSRCHKHLADTVRGQTIISIYRSQTACLNKSCMMSTFTQASY